LAAASRPAADVQLIRITDRLMTTSSRCIKREAATVLVAAQSLV
jgi:hypothetical protein